MSEHYELVRDGFDQRWIRRYTRDAEAIAAVEKAHRREPTARFALWSRGLDRHGNRERLVLDIEPDPAALARARSKAEHAMPKSVLQAWQKAFTPRAASQARLPGLEEQPR